MPQTHEDKRTLFSTHPTLVALVKKISRHVNHEDFSDKWNIGGYPYKEDFRAENKCFHSTAHIIPYIKIIMIYRISHHSLPYLH